ncbi:dehydrogenase [Paenibacillus riograndensis]|uniref:Dehydrogenase n=1 Tax=Paenibacillus riograndensis TaxID=483937 RepID=A0A132U4F2_9BACL|nr:Gfo/Idh/MocA family oxidoreductase [Paenibacillus riograndensis]KWX78417.1 dehydrogenase [Paenibacillus riograndensis]KWX88653.1 dehydrogenase [Paenibacillus riograndensis]
MNIGILGTGFGAYHASLLAKMEGVTRIVIFGRNEAKLGKLKKELGVEITTSIEAIISDPSLDLIDICLPSHLHSQYAIQALQAGKHVFCETPVCLSSADALAMRQAEERYGQRIMVNQFIKFDHAYTRLYESVNSGQYGKLLHVTLKRETAPLWGDLGLSKIAANLMIHELDMVTWLLGNPPISSIWGSSSKDGQALVHADFDTPQFSAEILVSSQMPEAYPFSVGYEAYFEQAKLVFHEVDYPDGKVEATLYEYGPAGKQEIVLDQGNPYEKSLRYALQSFTDGTPSIISLEHAANAAEAAFEITRKLA